MKKRISTFNHGYSSKIYTSSLANKLQDSSRQWLRIFNEPFQSSKKLAVEFLNSGNYVTVNHINRILGIFNLGVTDKGLLSLVNLSRLTCNKLTRSLLTDPKFLCDLGIGKDKSKDVKGVYIFTHHDTRAKYVGSSIQ